MSRDKESLDEFYDRMVALARRKVKEGYTYRIFYGKGNRNNRRIHVRAIIDQHQVVYAQWSRRWQTYRYYCKTLYEFGMDIDYGHLKRMGRTKIKE